MREFEPVKQIQDNTEQQIKFPKAKQFIKPMPKPHRGMVLWEIDQKTMQVEKAKYRISSIPVKEETLNDVPRIARKRGIAKMSHMTLESTNIHHEVDIRENCWYVWAVNKKNAIKQYRKQSL